MASTALNVWQTTRLPRLAELERAHATVGGQGPGRRWRTETLNHALVTRLAGEFQGYCRELHDLVSDRFAAWTAPKNAALEGVIKVSLLESRQLDSKNAQPGSLGSDFSRFGLQFWPRLTTHDRLTQARQAHLERVNRARNAIAHSNQGELQLLAQEGFPMTLQTYRRWKSAIDHLTRSMDIVTSDYLATLFVQPRPW
jgi:hypothetical protein